MLGDLKGKGKAAYVHSAADSSITEATAEDALTQLSRTWIQNLEASLAHSYHLQLLVMTEELTAGSRNSEHFELGSEWLLGLYLPDF